MFYIEDFEVHKLTLPLGRTVGDNNCSYDLINVTAVVLKSNHGHTGWGYAESAWQGKFKHDAWYVHQLPDLVTIESDFANSWWIQIQNKHPEDLEEERLNYSSGFQHLDTATRMALWDLMAKEKDLPLYKMLNPESKITEALAYGSILDFPLSDKEVLDLVQRFILDGFGIIKVKIGAEDPERDLRRLKLIQAYAGDEVRLTADANEAWDWQTTLARLELYDRNGIHLEYLEDPLRRDDLNGFAELTKRSPVPIIGHDYINQFEELKRLVEYGGLKGIRTGKDIDHSLKCIALAESSGIPVYLGNSIFEINAHLAMAFSRVNRTEFSLLATNDIIASPVKFKNGKIQAPSLTGHGLYPIPEKLLAFAGDQLLNQ